MENKGSKKKFIVMTALFLLVSLVILLYPRDVMVNGTGKTVSAANYSVAAGVSGKVVEIGAAEGAEVQAGGMVVKLYNDKLTREIKDLEKSLEIVEVCISALVEKDRQQHMKLRKSKNDLPPGAATSPAVEEAEKELEIIRQDTAVACKEKERVTAKLRYLQSFKDKERIIAPIDGVILSPVKGLAGRYLAEGEEAFRIGGKSLIVECFIPESKVQNVSVGSSVILKPYDRSGRQNHGIIISMDTKSEGVEVMPNAARVTIGITDAIVLTRGMKYQVRIYTGQRTSLVKEIVRHLPM